jgi:hypothetical protein
MKALNNSYLEFSLPKWFDSPEALKEMLFTLWNRRYYELHEEAANSLIEEAFEEALKAFGKPNDLTGHRRYVYMAWAMALAARPTLQHWFPEDTRPDTALEKIGSWAKAGVEMPADFAKSLFWDFPSKGAHTGAVEAYDIFYSSLRTLDQAYAYESMVSILEDAINGEAITPYYNVRRTVWNWWLLDVIPCAYYLRLPSTLCNYLGTAVPLEQQF